jgi:MOSC domain-containing protein YiiM
LKVVSVNIGERTTVIWNKKPIETGIFKYAVAHPIFLGNEDVTNDNVVDRKYHGGIDKACYVYSKDHYPYWKEKYPDSDLQLGAFGENITMENLDESNIFIGEQYQLGEAIVEISQPRQPCFKLGIRFGNPLVVKDFFQSEFPGVYLRIIKEGNVFTGDKMVLISQPNNRVSVAEVHSLFHRNKENRELAKKVIADEKLAINYKKDIIKMFK